MKPTLKRIATLCAGALLLACADIGYRAPPADPVPSAERAYLSGRAHHLAQRFEQAKAAYEEALTAVPMHVNARNGLAVLYAERGELDTAIGHWKEVTASNTGVESAFLFSNLGYAYYLRGEYAQAQATLENACLQDPLNYRAWRHLGNVLGKLGQHERAKAMHRQAGALLGYDFKSDYAVAPSSRVAAIEKAVRAASKDDERWAQTEVRQLEDGMFVLHRVEARSRAGVLLEISNGNGVTGMAKSMARTIGSGEGRVVRLTNQKGFAVRQTRVEYQPDFKLAAERLAQRIGGVHLVKVGSARPVDIRVVLGRDLVKPAKPAVAAALKPTPGAS